MTLPSVRCARKPWLTLLATSLLVLAGCGAGTGPSAGASPVNSTPAPAPPVSDCGDCGEVVIGITDADGDFLSYSVDVMSISLTRAGGAVVNLLPASARVDFAQYTELAEFFTTATVPNGVYVGGSISLDYANAEVFVEKNGLPERAVVTDASGGLLGVQEMRIELPERDQLVVRPGAPAILIVDFDLNASHTVDLEQAQISAVAEPFLLAEINPTDVKTLRVRGPLVTADTGQSGYTIALRPFHLGEGDFGRALIHTTDTTFFEVNGLGYKGTEGLEALSRQPVASATVALAELDVALRRFEASEVYAGSSVPGGDLDVARGTVMTRDADTLTLWGGTLVRENAALSFHELITVQLGSGTQVSRAGEPAFDGGVGAISVGQRIDVFGDVLEDSVNRGEIVMDAAGGRVRLRVTGLSGVVNEINAGLMSVNLQSLGGRPAGSFDFSGTGTAGNDADPQSYELATGVLPTDRINLAAPVRAAGFVSAFGVAPPDFEAVTIADFTAGRARFDIDWQPEGAIAPFLAADGTGIVLDLNNENIGRRHHLSRGGVRVELGRLEPVPVLTAATERSGIFAIRQENSVQLFNDFEGFTTELSARLDGFTAARGLHAVGGYNDATGEFLAHRIAVRLQ